MQGERTKGKRRKRKRNKLRSTLHFSQERASYFFFTGLLIIAIFGCVASGAPRQGFYGILFISIGVLIALFPPAFITSKWLNIGLILFFISLASSLLPRSFTGSQNWRNNLESLGLETGNLISPHPVATIESLIIISTVMIIGLCAISHRISRNSFLKIAVFFVTAVASYTGISIIFTENKWDWIWNPNNEFGFFANRNHMSTLMVMGSLVGVGSLFIYLQKKNWKGFIITLLATGIICWALLGYSVSRAGLILFISFQIIWLIFIGNKQLNYKFVTSFLVLFFLAIFLFLFSDAPLEKRLEKIITDKKAESKFINGEQKSEYTTVFGVRKYIHADTYNMIHSEPWTGTGLGTFEFIYPFYKKESIVHTKWLSFSNILHPESNWLDLASQAGIISVIFALICILPILVLMFYKNRKSRLWALSLSCILSFSCILVHGIFDVPGQKIGIAISGILLIGISIRTNYNKDKVAPLYLMFIYQLFAIGIFSLGVILIHSQWFSSTAIVFSDLQTRVKKIQNLYDLSIDASSKKNDVDQKKYIISAINLTESAIKRMPLDPDLHFTRGKLYSLLDGNEDKIKSSFKIESALDPNWVHLPLRQSKVWLFIDLKETRRLWAEALRRSDKLGDNISRFTWNRILTQAQQHPIQIRDSYETIIYKDDPYYFKKWMSVAGSKNLNIQMPEILKNNLLSDDTKNSLLIYWKMLLPNQYERYLESQS